MNKKHNFGGAKIPGNAMDNNDIVEFGFYCKRLMKVKSIKYLHKLYKKNPHDMAAFKTLYSEHFPDGITFEQWKFNPECETCHRFTPKGNKPCENVFAQLPAICTWVNL